MAVANRVGGLAFGLLEALFVRFYQYVVDPAPAGSWPFHVFQYLARGPFKCACLHTCLCKGPWVCSRPIAKSCLSQNQRMHAASGTSSGACMLLLALPLASEDLICNEGSQSHVVVKTLQCT